MKTSLLVGSAISLAFSKLTRRSLLVVVFGASLLTSHGAAIPKLYNTGVDDTVKALPATTIDPHYRIIEIPDGVTVSSNAFTLKAGFPVGPWIAEGPISRWIAPKADQSNGGAPGNYTYRTTFDLTGFDPAKASITGRWVSDNAGMDILLNGTSLGIPNPGNFGGWTDANNFSINSGFMAGTNTLDFVVNNAGTDINPTGLRVEMRGSVELPSEAPSIVEQPRAGTVIVGDDFTWTVVAQGTSPLSYQWQRNGAAIAGATDAALTVTGATLAQAGDYTVVVKNAFGTKTSAVAKLTVLEKLSGLFNTGVKDDGTVLDDLALDPHYKIVKNADGPSQDAFVEDSTVFPIVNGPWVANSDVSKWIAPRGETSAAAGGEYVYRLTFNLGDFDPTTVAIFGRWSTDNPGLDILVNGGSTGIGNAAQFSGYTSFSLTNGFVSGTNTLDFKLRNDGAGYTGLRVDRLRGGANKKTTTGLERPRIVTQPQGTVAFAAEAVTISVVADGTKPLAYQWTFNSQILATKTNSSLALANITTTQSGDYAVVVANAAGTATSSVAKVTVLLPVPGAFNTGVGDDRKPLVDGATDPHYRLVANAQDPKSLAAIVEDSSVFPIVNGPWVPNSATSKWIGPQFDPTAAGGDYVYRATFDLTGFDPATARLEGDWATDNIGPDLLLNGASTGLQNNAQFTALTHFVITSGFKPGTNTVEFAVNNAGTQANPTGLRIENLRLGAQAPATAGPSLSASRTGRDLTISWPASATGFKLFFTASLTSPNWTAVAEPVAASGTLNTVKIQATDTARFFRLQK